LLVVSIFHLKSWHSHFISVTVGLMTACPDEANERFNNIYIVEKHNPQKWCLLSILRDNVYFFLGWDEISMDCSKRLHSEAFCFMLISIHLIIKKGTSIIPQIFNCHSKVKVSFVQFPKINLESLGESFSWDSKLLLLNDSSTPS
jgi:hypothetical protein